MIWLLTFLLNHSAPTTLNAWACDLVNSKNITKSGCYDTCLELSMYQLTDGDIHDRDGRITLHNDSKYYQRAAIGLSEDFPHDLQNACAVVMAGGEY